MPTDTAILARIEATLRNPDGHAQALALVVEHFKADSGSLHLLENDGLLHLVASLGIPEFVLAKVRTVPVGRGMAGLAVERRQPVDACNIQTDTSGDVRPGAKASGLQGAIVVPVMLGSTAVGSLGIANRGERVFTAAETSALMQIARCWAPNAR